MSNSVFQSVIVQLKEISDRTFGVIDTEAALFPVPMFPCWVNAGPMQR